MLRVVIFENDKSYLTPIFTFTHSSLNIIDATLFGRCYDKVKQRRRRRAVPAGSCCIKYSNLCLL